LILVVALVLAVVAGPVGCASSSSGRVLDHEDMPRNFERVREMEDYALSLVERANRTRHPGRRRDLMTRALEHLKEARQLYEDELVEEPATPARQATIEQEMERLSDHIERIHKERPPAQ
jgi:hypothetical protein